MSIQEKINACCADGKLQQRKPGSLRGMKERRFLYASAEPIDGIPSLLEKLSGPWSDTKELQRWVFAGMYLDDFITAETITIPPNSRRAGKAFMSRLEPDEDEVWEEVLPKAVDWLG